MSRELLHEFKNQLGIVVGFAELLLDDLPAADRRRDDVSEIHRAALRALELVPRLAEQLEGNSNS